MDNPVTVTLGEMEGRAQHHLASGLYGSLSDVVRAGIRALDREEEAMNVRLRALIDEALADDRPPVPIEEIRARLEAARNDRAG